MKAMASNNALPSLMVFGSLSTSICPEYRSRIKANASVRRQSTKLLEAIRELQGLWQVMLDNDPRLSTVPGSECQKALVAWLDSDDFPIQDGGMPNTFSMPFTVIIQVLQYLDFLHRHDGDITHSDILCGAATGGTQGFCTGLLTAIAIAGASNEETLIESCLVAIRLAFCVGAYVDLDGKFGAEQVDLCCIVCRWNIEDGHDTVLRILRNYPEAYISVVTDATDVTITTTKETLSDISRDMAREAMIAKPISLRGRYHTARHADAFQRIMSLCNALPSLVFQPSHELKCPVRSNFDAQLLSPNRSLHEQALRCIMIETANWHLTLAAAVSQLMEMENPLCVIFGTNDCVPPSIVRERGLKLTRMWTATSTSSECKSARPSTGTGASESLFFNAPCYTYPDHAIAVVGMGCRFPGARNLDEFWDIMSAGKSMCQEVPLARFSAIHQQRSTPKSPQFYGNFLDDVDCFDHRFFKKSSREAATMDPQQRLLLEVAYETVESSGYFTSNSTIAANNIGCYIGVCATDYNDNVASHPANAFSSLGTLRAFLSGKISHYFGWTGPSLTVDTACSSSAVAIHTACKAIEAGECVEALAGGVSIYTSPYFYENLAAASFLSPTGPTKPFDAAADGYCRGEGAGLVFLKKLSAAIRDKDPIQGVITASAVAQNANSTYITVPHSPSQVDLYQRVLSQAALSPMQVSFVEAHGTGTPVGDPIEMQSIRQAFSGLQRRNSLVVSSVKGNIGHLEAASGVAALIKVCLMMQHRLIPIQANFKKLNPKIPPLSPDRIVIPTTTDEWNQEYPVACISNYGAAGSNAAIMVCSPPWRKQSVTNTRNRPSSQVQRVPISISAASVESLRSYARALAQKCQKIDESPTRKALLPSIAFNLARQSNKSFAYSVATTVASVTELIAWLYEQGESPRPMEPKPPARPVILFFSGQVGQSIGLDHALYESSPPLREYLDQCDSKLRLRGLKGLYPEIFSFEPKSDIVDLHCMLFAAQYSCAMTWIACGLKIDAVIGQSFGQLTALCISGILSLDDAITFVVGRASIIKNHWTGEQGVMISVEGDLESIQAILSTVEKTETKFKVEIACYNGPQNYTLAGDSAAIEALETQLQRFSSSTKTVKYRRIDVSHAFHSQLTEPILPLLRHAAEKLTMNHPNIYFEACSELGNWVTPCTDLLAHHTRAPVFLGRAIERLSERFGPSTWLEVFSLSSYSRLIKQNLPAQQHHCVVTSNLHNHDALDSLGYNTTALWENGHPVKFWPFAAAPQDEYEHIQLPPYQFEKTRHWLPLSAPGVHQETTQKDQASEPSALLTRQHSPSSQDSKSATFSINISSTIYKEYVQGHAVLGEPLCPAPLYLEMVMMACQSLKETSHYNDQTVMMRDLVIKAPLGNDASRQVSLVVEEEPGRKHAWHFQVSSTTGTATVLATQKPTIHAAGYLEVDISNAKGTAIFQRYERLVKLKSFLEIQTNRETVAVQGPLIYNIFAKVVNYAQHYKGVRGIWSYHQTVVAEVSLPETTALPHLSLSKPLAIDNFIQVAGLHVNSLQTRPDNEVYVCTQVDEVIMGPEHFHNGSSWIVCSELSSTEAGKIQNDIFVFDADSKTLVVVILGAEFAKVSATVLKKLLARANGGIGQGMTTPCEGKTAGPDLSQTSRAVLPSDSGIAKNTQRLDASSAVAKETATILGDLRAILVKIAEIPSKSLEDMTITFEDLGLDSLMSMELLGEINRHYDITISGDEFAELSSFALLFDCVCRKKGLPFQKVSSELEVMNEMEADRNMLSASTPHSVSALSQMSTMTPATSSETTSNGSTGSQLSMLTSIVTEHLGLTKIDRSTNLADAGLDSLLSIELVGDIQRAFGIDLDFNDLGPDPTFGQLAQLIFGPAPTPKDESDVAKSGKMTAESLDIQVKGPNTPNGAVFRPRQTDGQNVSVTGVNIRADTDIEDKMNLHGAQQCFEDTRFDFDTLALQSGFSGFWKEVYPLQAKLVLAYVVEAFDKLGCSLETLQAGAPIPAIRHLPKHGKLHHQLLRILQDADVVASTGTGMVRGEAKIDVTPSSSILSDIQSKFPQHTLEHKLLNITGSRLAECMNGSCDALQLLFRKKEDRDLLAQVYTTGPMYDAATKLLGAFLLQTYNGSGPKGTVDILEIGGGTGGTTKHIVDLLSRHKIPFTYTFTDLSSTLVTSARKSYEGHPAMKFMTLDIEKTPPQHMMGKFHTIISTNCVHATRNLEQSLRNIQSLLRPDGFVSLVEFTRNIYWFDLVFGLLEGWWLFEDGRRHVIADERTWERDMRMAGFKHVSWTDGASEESRTLRIITGFSSDAEKDAFKPRTTKWKPSIETFVWNQVGDTLLYADVYMPPQREAGTRPIALLFHGGGHVLFTKHDVGKRQISLLIDKGFLPVSVEYRLCPEVNLIDGPMHDACEAVRWAREKLPRISFDHPVRADGSGVGAVGWSTGGHLAMSTAFTCLANNIQAPEAVLTFYCPSDYESEWWKVPHQLSCMVSSPTEKYDLYEGLRDKPITGYYPPLNRGVAGMPMSVKDPRWRFVLHMNWKAQTLPLLLEGLPDKDGNLDQAPIRPQPPREKVVSVSPYAQIQKGNYQSPTYLVHGSEDDFIPWQQSQKTFQALRERGIPAGFSLIEGGGHLAGILEEPSKQCEQAFRDGFEFLHKHVMGSKVSAEV